MKKKVIALILILALALGVFAACGNIISKNDERVQAQVLATVTYKGDVLTVTYGQLLESYNSSGYIYVNYYGMTPEETLELLLSQLSNRKLLILYAKEQILKDRGFTGQAKDHTYEKLLSKNEINEAIKTTNKDMESALQSIVDSLREEAEANSGKVTYTGDKHQIVFLGGGTSVTGTAPSVDETVSGDTITLPENTFKNGDLRFVGWHDGEKLYTAGSSYTVPDRDANADGDKVVELTAVWSQYPAPRAVRSEIEAEDEEEEEDDYEIDLSWPAYNSTDALEPKMLVGGKLNDAYKQSADADTDLINDEYFSKALKTLTKSFETNFRSYDYYYQSSLESAIISRFELMLKKNAPGVTDADIEKEYERIIKQNKESFSSSSSAYETALGGTLSDTIYHPANEKGTYGFVLNLLLKFDDAEYKNLSDMMASGTATEATIREYAEDIAKNKKIWVSNPDFVNGDDTEEWYKHTVTFADGKCTCDVCGELTLDIDMNELVSYNATEKTIVNNCVGKLDKNHPYLPVKFAAYSNVEGAVNSVGIINQIYKLFDAVQKDYEAENIDAETRNRLLYEATKVWIYLVGDDSGMVTADTNKYGYLISPEGSSSSYLEAFTSKARELIKGGAFSFTSDENRDSLEKNTVLTWTDTTSSGYAGLFIIMPTYLAYDAEMISVMGDEGAAALERNVLPLDYVLEYGKTPEENKTLRKILEDKLIAARETAYYNEQSQKIMKDYADSVAKDDKVWKNLMKDIGL